MRPWDPYNNPLPMEHFGIPKSSPECEAFVVALKTLFDQYPVPEDHLATREGWRETALDLATVGNITRAIYYADDTGIPQDVLLAVLALFTPSNLER